MTKLTLFPLIALTTGALVAQYASAQSDANSAAPAPAATAAPDNSKSNKADKSLSTYAHNVKIVTFNGSVTLNGVVRSDEEKNVVEMKTAAVAGKDKVTNELKIAPAN